MKTQKILGFDNAKTSKGAASGYLTGIVYLAPYKTSGVNLCPKASAGCAKACLYTAGRGAFKNVQNARLNKTHFYLKRREEFILQLKNEIHAAKRKAAALGLKLAIRLNGTSDIVWEKVTDIIQSFPDVQFYDYTKITARFTYPLPKNYDLTFSLSESNDAEAQMVLALGGRVAAVFRNDLPSVFMGHLVVDGDRDDLRFLDPKRVIVGLRAKGKAKNDDSGFVRDERAEREKAA